MIYIRLKCTMKATDFFQQLTQFLAKTIVFWTSREAERAALVGYQSAFNPRSKNVAVKLSLAN